MLSTDPHSCFSGLKLCQLDQFRSTITNSRRFTPTRGECIDIGSLRRGAGYQPAGKWTSPRPHCKRWPGPKTSLENDAGPDNMFRRIGEEECRVESVVSREERNGEMPRAGTLYSRLSTLPRITHLNRATRTSIVVNNLRLDATPQLLNSQHFANLHNARNKTTHLRIVPLLHRTWVPMQSMGTSGNANLPIGNRKRAANQEIGDPAREKRIMRSRFSPKLGKFTALQVRQKPAAGLQLRKVTSPRFPFVRYPRQQRMSKRTILLLGPQGITVGQKEPEFCASLGVGRTIQEVGTEGSRFESHEVAQKNSRTCKQVRRCSFGLGLTRPTGQIPNGAGVGCRSSRSRPNRNP